MDTNLRPKLVLTLGLWSAAALGALLIRHLGDRFTILIPSVPLLLSVVLTPVSMVCLAILFPGTAVVDNEQQSGEGAE